MQIIVSFKFKLYVKVFVYPILKDENFTLLVFVNVVLAVNLTKLFHYQNRRGQLGNGFLLGGKPNTNAGLNHCCNQK